jgi:hypothetical protein
LNDVTLCAEVRNGHGLEHVEGESAITHFGGAIERVYLQPDHVRAYPETIRAILDADLIVLGPGSLYTSVLPNLLINNLPEALRARAWSCTPAMLPQRGENRRDSANARPRHRAAHRLTSSTWYTMRAPTPAQCAGGRAKWCASRRWGLLQIATADAGRHASGGMTRSNRHRPSADLSRIANDHSRPHGIIAAAATY